jgi:hypothetical protein
MVRFPQGLALDLPSERPLLRASFDSPEDITSAVEAAVAAVRRNAAVVMGEWASNRSIIVRTVESPEYATTGSLNALAVGQPMLALTARRFQVLRPTSDIHAETVLLPLPEGLNREALRRLVDPCAASDLFSHELDCTGPQF